MTAVEIFEPRMNEVIADNAALKQAVTGLIFYLGSNLVLQGRAPDFQQYAKRHHEAMEH